MKPNELMVQRIYEGSEIPKIFDRLTNELCPNG